MNTVSTQQAQMANNVKALTEQPFNEPVRIQTPTGMCSIYNHHLVSGRLIGIIGAILNLDFWGEEGEYAGPHVMSIVFRADGNPVTPELKRIWGVSHADTQSIAVNLKKHFDASLETCIELEPTCSIRSSLWHEIITTIAHEIHHVATIQAVSDATRAVWTEEDTKDEEASAKEWAGNTLLELATSDLDMEPPSLDEEPLFQMLFMAANLERLADKNLPEAITAAWDNQLLMLSNGWSWHHPESGTTCKSFVDWVSVEEAGEAEETLIESNKVEIINKDTGEVSEPLVADAFSIIPVSAAVVKKEAIGPFPEEKPKEEVEVTAQTVKSEVVEDVTVKTMFAGLTATTGQTNMFGNIGEAEQSAMDIAEAMDMDEFDADERVEGTYDDYDESPATIPPTATPAPETVGESAASEAVPEPAPAPEPEVRQAFDPNAVAATVHAVYLRCLNHLFQKCVPLNGIFQNPGAVYEPINISDIPGHEIFCGCDTILQNGQFQKRADRPGWVKGTIFNTSKLPAYHLYLNVGGIIMERRLVPQNANKTSKPAAEARAGNNIAWIIDAGPDGKFQMKYVNGQLSPCS